jgi:hypothetical protein
MREIPLGRRVLLDQVEFAAHPDLDTGDAFVVRGVPLDPHLLADSHPQAIGGYVNPDVWSAGRGRTGAGGQQAKQYEGKDNRTKTRGSLACVHLLTSLNALAKRRRVLHL